MEEKTPKTPKKCSNCRHHVTYYEKCAACFYRLKVGFCYKKRSVTENRETCEKWERKIPAAEKTLHVKAAETVLKNMSSHLAMIAQILSEDAEEKREEQKNR